MIGQRHIFYLFFFTRGNISPKMSGAPEGKKEWGRKGKKKGKRLVHGWFSIFLASTPKGGPKAQREKKRRKGGGGRYGGSLFLRPAPLLIATI